MSDSDLRALVVFCACPSRETALQIARHLVEERLAGCAQLIGAPIRSVYRWEGEVQEEEEYLLLLKTIAAAWEPLRDRVQELHPYSVPEILACPAQGNAAYLGWLAGEGSGEGAGEGA